MERNGRGRKLIFLIFAVIVAVTVKAQPLSPLIFSNHGRAVSYNAADLNQLADNIAKRDDLTVDIPIVITTQDDKKKTYLSAHCQVFHQAVFSQFLLETKQTDNNLYKNSILPLIDKTEQFLLQQHYQFHSIFLCICSQEKESMQQVIFKSDTKGSNFNLTSAQNKTGHLIVLTRSPNALVLFS